MKTVCLDGALGAHVPDHVQGMVTVGYGGKAKEEWLWDPEAYLSKSVLAVSASAKGGVFISPKK